MVQGISLANKCQLLFGFAVLVILAGALAVPWIRTQSLVRQYEVEIARQLSDAWLDDRIRLGTFEEIPEEESLDVRFLDVNEIGPAGEDGLLNRAVELFRDDETRTEFVAATTVGGSVVRRYVRPIRASRVRASRDQTVTDFSAHALDPAVADPLVGILVVDMSGRFAARQLLISRVYIITAWLVAGLLAVLVFYLILTKLILSPVRQLRDTTEKVEAGVLSMRSQIQTGDEFEQLSEAFNSMLDRVEVGQSQLRAMNESLDLKLNELAEANVGLFESNRLKSEFLANVSHELRTPLNSIIGFAELLDEIARNDGELQVDPKRVRYIRNILSSGRALLEMINELLDMAKIEAGRMEVNIEPTSVSDLIEGLLGIMRPQAEAKQIELSTDAGASLPLVETDPGKLQQILYNFLSNAIKFTPVAGRVTISAERVRRQDNSLGVRLAVADSGPGIPEDMQDIIFEKFRQVDAGHTRAHTGTGLGLAICRELADMLGASVSFTTEPGRGATFFVDLAVTHQPEQPQPLMG
ncbi:MAG: sensor histidine kinase [Planctomycetota bacterium]|jgi:signal transduction histidine kinase